MNDIRDQFQRAAGDDDRSLAPADLGGLKARARGRQTRRRAGMAGIGLAAVTLLGVGVASAGGDGPAREQLTASAGDELPGVDSSTTSAVAPDTSAPPVTSEADPGPSSSTVPETTAPVITIPDSTTTPDTVAPTTAPNSGTANVLSISGTFSGTSPILSGTQQHCEQLIHELDATMSLDGGESWTLHENYCGRLDGDMWLGKGTFTLTAESGDTLTGTFTSRAPVPTTGEPYQLTITGGTGGYAGASGTCNIDNHLRPAGPGLQEQYGTFTCDATLPAASIDQ